MRSKLHPLFVLSIALFAGIGCSERSENDFDFTTLLGRWASADTASSQLEEWERMNDSTYIGRGYILEGGDTTFFETLEIRNEQNCWTYYAKVKQMNGEEVIPFRLSKQSARRVEFVNNNHDFPKKIGYELISDSELQAYIEGPRNGQNVRILFDFKKK
jgi:hypothetical protein